MENLFKLISMLSAGVFALVPFILLLGGLIFIHELGHFLVARYFKVKVEVFSLGFGPKILKYKKGDTLYCLSLLPLGGYVKMFGDNPLQEVPEEEKQHGFLYKKAHQKWLIAFAGPFFNLVFALFGFFVIALSGVEKLPAKLGDLSKNSLAFKKGFRSGDHILSVNGQKVSYYEELDQIIKEQEGKTLSFETKEETGQIKLLKIESQKVSDLLAWGKERIKIEGFTIFSQGLSLGVPSDSMAFEKGFRSFDTILALSWDSSEEMRELRFWRELESLPASEHFRVKLKRDSETKEINVKLDSAQTLLDLGLEPSVLYIEKIGANTPAERAGLKRGDRLVAVGEERLTEWKQMIDKIKESEGESLEISYQRAREPKLKGESLEVMTPGFFELQKVSVKPEKIFVEGNVKSQYMIGIVSGSSMVLAPEIVKKYTFWNAMIYSGQQTWKWLNVISLGLVRLIKGEFSVRSMGGPIAIGRAAHSSFVSGFTSFLFIMTLISLNLFLFNLLPIPVLDGGHLLFFGLEACLGRPLSLKKLIIAQNIGLVFILTFMSFAIFNDIYNWLSAW